MNAIPNNLSKKEQQFFYKLNEYLDTKVYFYGSVNRSDYKPGESDIDVALFTDNEYSTISKLQHFLDVSKSEFRKVVWKLDNHMIYGFKIKCDKIKHLNCEIAIYNNEFKTYLLDEYNRTNYIPWFNYILLMILKFFYYDIPIVPSSTFSYLKRKLFNEGMGQFDSAFYVF